MEIGALKELMDQVLNTRTFKSEPVPQEHLAEILEAFRLGPSLANTQPWEVLIVEGEAARKRAASATLDLLMTPGTYGGQRWVTNVPVLMAICLDRPRSEARIGERGVALAAQDTCASLQNARIMAAALGLRTAVCKELDPAKMREALELPWTTDPLWLLAVGYSDTPLEVPPRLAVRDFVQKGGWGQEWNA